MDDGRRLLHLPRLLRSGQFDHDRGVGEGSGGDYGQEGEDQGGQVSLRESRRKWRFDLSSGFSDRRTYTCRTLCLVIL
jgi:hypothetical protein